MSLVDARARALIDQYRRQLDRAELAEDEPRAMGYAKAARRLLKHFAVMGRLAWAVEHPLSPVAADVLCSAVEVGGDDLYYLLPELRRFGRAILVQGDPAKLDELGRIGERERLESELLQRSMEGKLAGDNLEAARQYARIFETRLRLIAPEQRTRVLAELEAALAHD